MTEPVRFVAYGVPMAKGSAKSFIPKGWTRPIITSTNKGLKAWEHVVSAAAQTQASGILFGGPLKVSLDFYLPRPKSMPARIRLHAKRPDLDKIIRGSLDALNNVLWKDDSQVVILRAVKRYTDGDDAPRAEFTITPLNEDEVIV